MERQDLMLAALAAAKPGAQLPPAQLQKLFFLIDREIPGEVGGPHFDFRPYDFGPFDARVYTEVDALQLRGLAAVSQGGRYRTYSLTASGLAAGQEVLAALTPRARSFIERAATWVCSQSFEQLVSAIYKRYPEMKAKSIFRGVQAGG